MTQANHSDLQAMSQNNLYLVKFWSKSCGICGRMSKYDTKVAEELNLNFVSVRRSDTEVWEKFTYLAKQLYDEPKSMGYPTYILGEGSDDGTLKALGEVRGGSDKGAFRRAVLAVIEEEAALEGERGKCQDEKYQGPMSGPKYAWAVLEKRDTETIHYDGWTKLWWDGKLIYNRDRFDNTIEVNGVEYKKGSFQEQRQNPMTNGGGESGSESPVDNEKEKFYAIKSCAEEECSEDFTLEMDCPQDCGKASGTRTIKAKANGVRNSDVKFTWFKGAAQGGNGEIVKQGKGVDQYDAPCPPAGTDQKYACQAEYKEGNCDITKTDNCVIATDADKPDPTPEPTPAPTEGCNEDFTLELDCPQDCGKASGTRTIKASANGVRNSDVKFTWFKGAAQSGNGEIVKQGMGATQYDAPCPPAGTDQKYACQAEYKEGNCDITRTENCVIATDADTPAPTAEPTSPPASKPNCKDVFFMELDCPRQGPAGDVIELTANANGVANSNVYFTWYRGSKSNNDVLRQGTGVDKFSHRFPFEQGETEKISVWGSYADKCDGEQGDNCDITSNVEESPCSDVFTIDLSCPDSAGNAGDLIELTANVTGADASKIYFTWYNGSKSDNDVIRQGTGATQFTARYPFEPGTSKKISVWGSLADECNGEVNDNCTLYSKAENPDTGYQCKPNVDCGTIQGVDCGDCDSGFECKNGKCVEEEKYQCKPNVDCGTIQGVDCGDCDGGLECKNGKCVQPDCDHTPPTISINWPPLTGTPGAAAPATMSWSPNYSASEFEPEWYVECDEGDTILHSDCRVGRSTSYTFTYPPAGQSIRVAGFYWWSPGDAKPGCSGQDWEIVTLTGSGGGVTPTPEPTDDGTPPPTSPTPEPTDPCDECEANNCEECVNNECVSKCRDDQECDGAGNCVCPNGYVEVDGQCIEGNCVGDGDCSSDDCEECVNNECKSKCRDDQECDGEGNCVCPDDHIEVDGKCIEGNCIDDGDCSLGDCEECVDYKCKSYCDGSHQVCDDDGVCVCEDGYDAVYINGRLYCRAGCVDDPNAVEDNDGKCVCKNGYLYDPETELCVELCEPLPPVGGTGECDDDESDPCHGVTCLPPKECVDGDCVCPDGTVDVNGLCMSDDRCLNVLCPPNATCVDGTCVCDEGYLLNGQGYCVQAETAECEEEPDCCPSNATIQIKAGNGLGGGGTFRLNQPCDKTIMLWVDDLSDAVDDNCDENGLANVCSCTGEIAILMDMIVELKAELEIIKDNAEECLERNECPGFSPSPSPTPTGTGTGDPTPSPTSTDPTPSPTEPGSMQIYKLLAGPRITLDPAHGDLTLGDITITASGNTGPGVDVIYDPIFVDLEPEGSWKTPTAQFDFMGSTEVKEPDNVYKYILKDIDASEVVPVKMPADTNGAFVEINFRISHSPSALYCKNHPAYQLDCPAETFIRAKNILTLGNAEFISGSKTDFHSQIGLKTCCKLSPSTIQPGVSDVGGREVKMNFCTFQPGAEITIKTMIAVMQMHYSDFGMGLGRVKIIPVKVSDLAKAKEWILPQIADYNDDDIYANRVSNRNSGGDGQTHDNGIYYFQESDAARINGNDIRQAVDQLNSAIDLRIATGGDQAALEQLRRDLDSKVLKSAADFNAIRNELTAIKQAALNLGAIGLTTYEQNAGVVWDKPGLPVA